ncbi:MAG: ATP-binding protein [Bacteroidota bacterium]
MKFINRESEIKRLKNAIESPIAKLVVIYGRRRCGKSTLIRNIFKKADIYFMAQQADESVQRIQLAKVIGEKIVGFDKLIYPDWESLFLNLNNTLKENISLCLDEFPYLVKSSSIFPSLIQKITDDPNGRKYHLILCGSSQQMMHGLVLDSTSPLYGRADEILNIQPIKPAWIIEALDCTPLQAVQEYSVWGGVPRYWELRKEKESFEAALKSIVFDRLGVLHEEPARLFLDDMRESVQAFSILSIVGMGSNRISEIAARLNKPVTQLSRPIDNLINLGYLKREIPYGGSLKTGKKSIYRISDPFMNFYFSFVSPNLSRLQSGLIDQVYESSSIGLIHFFAKEWENLCRICIPFLPVEGINFDLPSRWWGNNVRGEQMELDLVCESTDKKWVLIGECKWSRVSDPTSIFVELEKKAELLPFIKDKKIITVLFVKELSLTDKKNPRIFTPEEVLSRLK